MYIGSTGSRGLHHLVYEVVDNSVDEALAGHYDCVEVDAPPGRLGDRHGQRRGHPRRHDGGPGPAGADGRPDQAPRRRQVRRRGYKVSGGLHGVGVSVVNALSEWLVAEVQRDGKI